MTPCSKENTKFPCAQANSASAGGQSNKMGNATAEEGGAGHTAGQGNQPAAGRGLVDPSRAAAGEIGTESAVRAKTVMLTRYPRAKKVAPR